MYHGTTKRRRWVGGRRVVRGGYITVWDPDHPLARADGYVFEHRKVAWDAGLFSDPSMHVHHINGQVDDNRVKNLQALTAAEHQAVHHLHDVESYDRCRLRVRSELGQRSCEVCGIDITARRIDATVCGNTCRVTRWKRANT